jgi:UDP-hydrolysing UDP-N-acetyl-D-glucosamine 2-epimerase
MSEIRTICAVTGSRADYGLLSPVLRGLRDSEKFELKIVATGMHLSPEFGLTYRVIEENGFRLDEKVEMLLSSDSEIGVAKSIGLGVIGFADSFERLEPDLVMLLGDRFEIFAAAQAAMVERIPLAHLFGGDTTEGAFDEMIRHSLTKMSHIHFVTNSESERRVCQMGENPELVFNVGSPGLDVIKEITYLGREELEKNLKIAFQKVNILLTFHPSTLEGYSSQGQIKELFSALEEVESTHKDVALIFTQSNADTEGRLIGAMIEEFARKGKHRSSFVSLGQERYLSMMRAVDVVVGNSSSGLYEAPAMEVPTVNIGDRQKGRLRATSVIDCRAERGEILQAIQDAMDMDCSGIANPYGDGESGRRIVETLESIPSFSALLQKRFFEVEKVK